MSNQYIDYLIIGGGLFGSYAAKILAPRGSVALIEQESFLLSRASKNNQTRLHNGCHYLRAPRTARDAKQRHDEFLRDHEFAIFKTSKHYYGIARDGSLTDANGFERFCEWLSIDKIRQENVELFANDRLSDLYLVNEYSFDPFLLSKFYLESLKDLGVNIKLNSKIKQVTQVGNSWDVKIVGADGEITSFKTQCVINATYSNINSVAKLFSLPESAMKHEFSELLLVKVPSLKDTAITIMDGPFLSITPYGFTGLHVLSSVVYTHHFSTRNSGGKMSCQVHNSSCETDKFNLCETCPTLPSSRQKLMLNQLKAFVPNVGPVFVHGNLKTVKSTWSQDDYRDERTTSIRKMSSNPDFYNVMSGKVSNIYEIKELFDV